MCLVLFYNFLFQFLFLIIFQQLHHIILNTILIVHFKYIIIHFFLILFYKFLITMHIFLQDLKVFFFTTLNYLIIKQLLIHVYDL